MFSQNRHFLEVYFAGQVMMETCWWKSGGKYSVETCLWKIFVRMGGDQLTGGVELTGGRVDLEGTILLRKPTEAAIPVFIRLLTWPTEAAMSVCIEGNYW